MQEGGLGTGGKGREKAGDKAKHDCIIHSLNAVWMPDTQKHRVHLNKADFPLQWVYMLVR